MGYHLTIWEGPVPADDAEGLAAYRTITKRYLVQEPVEVSPAIQRFGAALANIWTDDTKSPFFEDGPWKWLPILDGASGRAVHLNIVFRNCAYTSSIIACVAQEHGLVCFDPQVCWLRPIPEELSVSFLRRWRAAQLAVMDSWSR